MKGKVKFFNRKKGYGFITGEDGKDYFIHVSYMSEGTKIDENDEVTFNPEQGEKGIKAANVKVDKKASPEAGQRDRRERKPSNDDESSEESEEDLEDEDDSEETDDEAEEFEEDSESEDSETEDAEEEEEKPKKRK